MRADYHPHSAAAWSQQFGGGFVGYPYQRGAGLGNVFRSIFRAILPLAKRAGRTIGKQALSTGAQIASDVVAGENWRTSSKRRIREGAAKTLRKSADTVQGGRGLGKRPATKSIKGPAVKRRRKKSDALGCYYG